MTSKPTYTVTTGHLRGDDEMKRTALVVICDAVDSDGQVVDRETLDEIKNDLLVNHRDVVEPHTVVYVNGADVRGAAKGSAARQGSSSR